jgi:hypothetical protein
MGGCKYRVIVLAFRFVFSLVVVVVVPLIMERSCSFGMLTRTLPFGFSLIVP